MRCLTRPPLLAVSLYLQVFAGLPVVFVQGNDEGWGQITCDVMAQHAIQVAERLKEGFQRGKRPFQYEKLTIPYWVRFVRNGVWAAEAEIRRTGIDVLEPTGYLGSREVYPEMTVGTPS